MNTLHVSVSLNDKEMLHVMKTGAVPGDALEASVNKSEKERDQETDLTSCRDTLQDIWHDEHTNLPMMTKHSLFNTEIEILNATLDK